MTDKVAIFTFRGTQTKKQLTSTMLLFLYHKTLSDPN